jgi:hypothetical protein
MHCSEPLCGITEIRVTDANIRVSDAIIRLCLCALQVRLPRDHEAISELLRRTLAGHVAWAAVMSFSKAVLSTGTGLLHFFPVDNTAAPGSDPAVGHLRAALTTAVSAEAYVQRRVPFSWLQVMPRLHCFLAVLKIGANLEGLFGNRHVGTILSRSISWQIQR